MGLVIPLSFLFFLRSLRNYVSIIVNIISNNTVLQCYFLWIFVSIRRLLQLLCIGVSNPPHLKNTTFSLAKSHLKSANYPSPSFLGNSPPSPLNFFFFIFFSYCLSRNTLFINLFCSDEFSKENKFLLLTLIAGSFSLFFLLLDLILLFCIYVS